MADPTSTYTPTQSAAIKDVGASFSSGAGAGATDAEKQAIAGVQSAFSGSNVPAITSTPTMISSKDMAGSFASASASLASKTMPPPQTTQAPDTKIETDAKQKLNDAAANGDKPSTTTGDPILDSLQLEADKKTVQAKADADAKKQQIQSMLQTNLAANDATYAAQIQSITSTYQGLIDTQTRINNLTIDRTKAYGLAGAAALGAPGEFTNAVSQRETDATNAIKKLDNERDSLIAQAKSAQAQGDAKLLQESMDAIDKAEADMRTQASQLQNEVNGRYTLLQNIEKEQLAQQQQQAQQLLAAAATKYGDLFADATDSKKKDSLVKQIIADSGGTLDYTTVLSSLSSYAANKQAAETKAAQDKADLAYKQAQTNAQNAEVPLKAAQTNAANASADKARAEADKARNQKDVTQPSEVYSAINNFLQPNKTLPGSNGVPVLEKGTNHLTKAGFQALVNSAVENGIDRASFLKQYATYLNPNAYADYGLTKSEQDALNNVNKTKADTTTQ